ncbi:MAG: Phenylacetic acid catabolic protein, partial [Salinirussus sp.]
PMIAFFVDGAAMRRQATLKSSSWEPYAHAMDKICFEEGMHVKHGESILRELTNGSRKEQRLVQEAFDEWWPRILQFFGPTDDRSTHHGFATEVGLKTKSNDELRNAFLRTYMKKARKYGLEIPDEPRIRERDDGTYEVVEEDLDWDEFFTVSKNEYEPGVGQIDSRRRAQEAVQWVRDAMESPSGTGASPAPQAAD